MTMSLELDPAQLQKALDAALLKAIGEKGQEQILKEVIRHLTTEEGSYMHGTRTTPLMAALKQAARQAADNYFSEKLKNDPAFTQALEDLFRDAWKQFVESETRPKLVSEMAYKIADAFKGKSY